MIWGYIGSSIWIMYTKALMFYRLAIFKRILNIKLGLENVQPRNRYNINIGSIGHLV